MCFFGFWVGSVDVNEAVKVVGTIEARMAERVVLFCGSVVAVEAVSLGD